MQISKIPNEIIFDENKLVQFPLELQIAYSEGYRSLLYNIEEQYAYLVRMPDTKIHDNKNQIHLDNISNMSETECLRQLEYSFKIEYVDFYSIIDKNI